MRVPPMTFAKINAKEVLSVHLSPELVAAILAS